jgi:hypothetical protein
MINCLPVRDLTTEELRAEIVCILKVFWGAELALLDGGFATLIRSNRDGYNGATTTYQFFFGRLGYLAGRVKAVKDELDRRKDKTFEGVEFRIDKFKGVLPSFAWGNWRPNLVDLEVNRQDIILLRRAHMVG